MFNIESFLDSCNQEINKLEGMKAIKGKDLDSLNKEIAKNDALRNENIEKKIILQEACRVARDDAAKLFSSVATNALKTILGDNLSVNIINDEKGGVPVSDFRVKATYDDYETETDPVDEEGGGVSDIIALTSLICLNSLNENNLAPVVLDEPTKFVSAAHAEKVGEFLSKISKDLNKQIIMVTHAQETQKYADVTLGVHMNEYGVSEVVQK